MTACEPAPKVFVSYCWTNQQHMDWVESLAKKLRENGVDASLDQWDLHPGNDMFAFMERILADPAVRKILVVCDKGYSKKATNRQGGVGTESQLIAPQVYSSPEQQKIVPLIRERDQYGEPYTPPFLASTGYIDFCDDAAFEESFERLLRDIFGRPSKVKPALGAPPPRIFSPATPAPIMSPSLTSMRATFQRLKAAVEEGKPFSPTILQEFLDSYLDALEEFRISSSPKNREVFGTVVMDSISAFVPYRNLFVDLVFFLSGYMDGDEPLNRLAEFFGRAAAYQRRPESTTSWSDEDFDNYRFIVYELFLYTLATFIKASKASNAGSLLSRKYSVASTLGGSVFYEDGPSVFNEYIRSLDEGVKERGATKNASVTANLIEARATYPTLSARDLFQADLIAFLRTVFEQGEDVDLWYPRCASQLARGEMLELFSKATTAAGFQVLKDLLGVSTSAELVDRLRSVAKGPPRWGDGLPGRILQVRFKELVNVEGLSRAGL